MSSQYLLYIVPHSIIQMDDQREFRSLASYFFQKNSDDQEINLVWP